MPDVSTQNPKMGFVGPSCSRTLADSEQIITQLHAEGYETSGVYGGADPVVVNTCGFIDEAVQESLDTIGEVLAEGGKVIVTGCLGARKDVAGQDIIISAHPKMLVVTGSHVLGEVMETVHTHLPKPHDPFTDPVPPQGIKLTPKYYACLRISEDCSHRCSFYIIPSMHGDLVSRPVAEMMLRAGNLPKVGMKGLFVISQDTNAYSVDVKLRVGFWNDRPLKIRMTELMGALDELASQYGVWMCLHYVYPYPSVDEVMPLTVEGKVLPCLDVLLQHVHPDVLKHMKRSANVEKMLGRIRAWREVCPKLTIRSAFTAGFPGETEEEFQTLLDSIAEAELGRVDCFACSPVEGATTNDLPGALPDEVCEGRYTRFMEIAEHVSVYHLQRKVGKSLRVLVDEVNQDGGIGRSLADAPGTDSPVYIAPPSKPYKRYKTGNFMSIKAADADGHDPWGEV